MHYHPAPILPLKRTMVFIDGGYFRRILEDHFGGGIKDNPGKISEAIAQIASQIIGLSVIPHSRLEIIRIYYYDGLEQANEPEYQERLAFFQKLHSSFTYCPFELKYGRLIKSEKDGPRQKGVDVLLSVDMVVKAFQDHYDIAVLIAGDDDFLDAVRIVKDLTGKRVIGVFRPKGTSPRLIESFDIRLPHLPLPFLKGFEIN